MRAVSLIGAMTAAIMVAGGVASAGPCEKTLSPSPDSGPDCYVAGRVFRTQGIAALPDAEQSAIFEKVETFDTFTPDIDPHGEHDFGAFEHEGKRIFWKIDYYAPDMEHGSENPADPQQTVRVLTIMLASEY